MDKGTKMKSRIQKLIEEVQQEQAERAIDERLADEAADHFGLTEQERIAYLKAIHPVMIRRPAITIARALQAAA